MNTYLKKKNKHK